MNVMLKPYLFRGHQTIFFWRGEKYHRLLFEEVFQKCLKLFDDGTLLPCLTLQSQQTTNFFLDKLYSDVLKKRGLTFVVGHDFTLRSWHALVPRHFLQQNEKRRKLIRDSSKYLPFKCLLRFYKSFIELLHVSVSAEKTGVELYSVGGGSAFRRLATDTTLNHGQVLTLDWLQNVMLKIFYDHLSYLKSFRYNVQLYLSSLSLYLLFFRRTEYQARGLWTFA